MSSHFCPGGVRCCIGWLLFITGALRRYAAGMVGDPVLISRLLDLILVLFQQISSAVLVLWMHSKGCIHAEQRDTISHIYSYLSALFHINMTCQNKSKPSPKSPQMVYINSQMGVLSHSFNHISPYISGLVGSSRHWSHSFRSTGRSSRSVRFQAGCLEGPSSTHEGHIRLDCEFGIILPSGYFFNIPIENGNIYIYIYR